MSNQRQLRKVMAELEHELLQKKIDFKVCQEITKEIDALAELEDISGFWKDHRELIESVNYDMCCLEQLLQQYVECE